MDQVISVKPVNTFTVSEGISPKVIPLLTVQTRWITHLAQVGNTGGLLYLAFYTEPVHINWEDYTRVFNVLHGIKNGNDGNNANAPRKA